MESLKGLGRKKPSREALSEQIQQALSQAELAEAELVEAGVEEMVSADGRGEMIVIEEEDLPPVVETRKKRRWRRR
jgi:hypothetical protein